MIYWQNRSFIKMINIFRKCPGKKEFVSVEVTAGKIIHKQKRLRLVNLKELYLALKYSFPDNLVGLSRFCSLQPPWCVSVAAFWYVFCVCLRNSPKLKIIGFYSTTKYGLQRPNWNPCLLFSLENVYASSMRQMPRSGSSSENCWETFSWWRHGWWHNCV